MSSVRSLVGTIRLNEAIGSSSLVKTLRSKFPKIENFDLIEIFNNSVPNDPSPPSKALAVLHRSTSSGVPVATNVVTKILDYNNRDFHKWQMHRLVEDIGTRWLKECGGGVFLTIHRDSASADLIRDDSIVARLNRYLNRNRNCADKKDVEIFSQSTEINGEKNWKNFKQFRYFWEFKWKANGDSSSDALTVFHTDNMRRIVYTHPIDPTVRLDRISLHDEVQKILRKHKCFEAVVLFDNPLAESEANFYHAFTVNKTLVEVADKSFPSSFSLNSIISFKHLI